MRDEQQRSGWREGAAALSLVYTGGRAGTSGSDHCYVVARLRLGGGQ